MLMAAVWNVDGFLAFDPEGYITSSVLDLKVSQDATVKQGVSGHASFRLRYFCPRIGADYFTMEKLLLQLREAYLEASFDFLPWLYFIAGKKRTSFGEADIFDPMDVVDPLEVLKPTDLSEKTPSWILAAGFSAPAVIVDEFELTVLYRIFNASSYIYFIPSTSFPQPVSYSVENGAFALMGKTVFGVFSTNFLYYRGRDSFPLVKEVDVNAVTGSVVFTSILPWVSKYGAGISAEILEATLFFEAVYNDYGDYSIQCVVSSPLGTSRDKAKVKNTLSLASGLEFSVYGFDLNVQYFKTLPWEREIEAPEGFEMLQAKTTHQVAGKVSRKFFGDRFEATVAGIYSFQKDVQPSWLVISGAKAQFAPGASIGASYIYSGGEGGFAEMDETFRFIVESEVSF